MTTLETTIMDQANDAMKKALNKTIMDVMRTVIDNCVNVLTDGTFDETPEADRKKVFTTIIEQKTFEHFNIKKPVKTHASKKSSVVDDAQYIDIDTYMKEIQKADFENNKCTRAYGGGEHNGKICWATATALTEYGPRCACCKRKKGVLDKLIEKYNEPKSVPEYLPFDKYVEIMNTDVTGNCSRMYITGEHKGTLCWAEATEMTQHGPRCNACKRLKGGLENALKKYKAQLEMVNESDDESDNESNNESNDDESEDESEDENSDGTDEEVVDSDEESDEESSSKSKVK